MDCSDDRPSSRVTISATPCRTRFRFSQEKARADGGLTCTENLKVSAAAALNMRPHCAGRELRCIAIAREMTENNALNFSRKQLLDDRRRGRIGKMTVP